MPAPDLPSCLESALALARAGYRVLPLHTPDRLRVCSCGDKNCPNPGKHPRTKHGSHDATDDEDTITGWWIQWPDANVGVACGGELLGLDIDPGKGGEESIVRLCREHDWHPVTLSVGTGSGGWHYYLTVPPGRARQSVSKLGPGIDTRGENGYLVAPPSLHASGRRYEWVKGSTPTTPRAPAPSWLLEQLGEPAQRTQDSPAATYIEGGRNDALFRLARAWRANTGMSAAELEEALLTANAHRCRPPLADREVRAIARSVSRYEGGEDVAAETGVSDAVAKAPTRLTTAEIFAPLPPIPWLVEGLRMAPGAPVLVAGYGYSGKTIAAQSLALACAAGSLVWEAHRAARPCRVLHLDYEQGQYLTRRRYQRLASGAGLSLADLGARLELSAMPRFRLDAQGAEDAIRRACAGFDLIIIDSLRASIGLDENDSKVRQPLDTLARVSELDGAVFLVIHHARKPQADSPGGATMAIRGSGALFDACACVYVFEGQGEGRPALVHHVKERITGTLLPDLELHIGDTDDGGLAVALRATVAGSACANLERVKREVLEALEAVGGECASERALGERVTGKSSTIAAAIEELQAEGKVHTKPGIRRAVRILLGPEEVQ